MSESFALRFLLPQGARVMPLVTRACTVEGRRTQVFSGEPGIVIQPAADLYSDVTVQYESGAEIHYKPHEIVPLGDEPHCPFNLRECIVLKTRIGSHAHGIAHEESDDDFRGVFCAPADLHWSMRETPRRIEHLRDGLDEMYYEIGGFVRRMLKGDPMAVETLFSDLIEHRDNVGDYLLARRKEFLTLPALMGFPYFLREQMRDLGRRHRKNKRVKPKALMHSLRLALAANRAVRTGEFTLDAGEHADDLIAIREGQWHFEDVNRAVHATLKDFEDALDDSPLPRDQAVRAADDCLIFARAEFARRWLEAHNGDVHPQREAGTSLGTSFATQRPDATS